jgi:hypothetical protein
VYFVFTIGQETDRQKQSMCRITYKFLDYRMCFGVDPACLEIDCNANEQKKKEKNQKKENACSLHTRS